jgi:hypothetical protein
MRSGEAPGIKQKAICGLFHASFVQGCQVVYFQTKNINLGKFLRALEWKGWYILWLFVMLLRPFGIFYGHLVHFPTFLVCCVKKNLATLYQMATKKEKTYLNCLIITLRNQGIDYPG